MNKTNTKVTLPEGISLRSVAKVLLDAWEVGSHQWKDGPFQLREGEDAPPPPVPRDALDLFRALDGRRVSYLLVGGVAMLTYVQGRNTKDVDLLMSAAAMEQLPELEIKNRSDWFVRAKFRTVQVDLLLTSNPLFRKVGERFATRHHFAELEVPAATVEGLIVLKLYALPSLYRQMDMDRVALYENDITMLLARHSPKVEPLLALVEAHIEPGDINELRKITAECAERAKRLRERTGS